MEQFVENVLTNFGIPLFWVWVVIPIVAGIVLSLVTAGVDSITPKKVRSIPLLLGINFVVTVLVLLNFPSYVTLFSLGGFMAFIVNFFAARLFYKFGGKLVIEKLFKKLIEKGNARVDNG